MAFLNKILLPVDFSERCRGVVHYLEALADPSEAEIFLLHVSVPASYELSSVEFGGPILSSTFASQHDGGEAAQLNSFLAEELHGYRTHRVALLGDPARKIVQFAHDNAVDLVMMPTHGYGLFRRFLLGSVTAKVLHDAECPVWTGAHMALIPAARKIRFQTIVVALDLCMAPAVRTLTWARRIAQRFGATLVIAHAYPSLEGRTGESFDPTWPELFRSSAAVEIGKIQAAVGTDAEVCIEGGDVPHVVCSIAERHKADLLVIGRTTSAGVFGRLHANAYAITRQSPCPVLSV